VAGACLTRTRRRRRPASRGDGALVGGRLFAPSMKGRRRARVRGQVTPSANHQTVTPGWPKFARGFRSTDGIIRFACRAQRNRTGNWKHRKNGEQHL